MKKKYLYVIVLFCSTIYNGSCQNKNEFDLFLIYFNPVELPYNTIKFNSNQELILISKRKKIEKTYSVKYFFSGDEKKLQYPYRIYQMEDRRLIDKGFKDYNIYPIGKCFFQNHIGLFYFKSGMYESKCYLSLFTKEGTRKDTLVVNNKIGDNEYSFVQASFIENKRVIVFNYESNPEFTEKAKKITGKETIPRTIITILTYSINDTLGKFEFIDQKKQYSQCSVDEIALKEDKCKEDDPMNSLPLR